MKLNADVPPVTIGTWYRPAVQTSWHWQLSGTVNTTYAVSMFDLDLFDTSAETIALLQSQNKRVICYFSAGSFEDWRSDVDDIPAAAIGNALDGWDNERWLDIRSGEVQNLVLSRLALAQTKGCDGVEPDNVDVYTNDSGFNISATDQLAFNRFIANEAHNRGLAVGLKNDLDQIEQLVAYFDFSVNEQCFEYDECDRLSPFIQASKPVFNAEYHSDWVGDSSDASVARDELCADANDRRFSTLVLPLDLDGEFRYPCF
jgi:hypothetical protein